MRKTILSLLIATVCITIVLTTFKGYGLSAYASAKSEIAMEITTGKILAEGNADVKLPMASTTKILTAIIIIEDCALDQIIKVPAEAAGVEGSSIYLKKDEEIDVRDLLYGLMLRSGNDAAVALAIHRSGSIEKFAEEMNARAKSRGAENSNFKNPSGLPDNEHYTTARDLCKIACYAMNNPVFKEVVSTINYNGKFRSFTNKNKMLRNYEGANGVKTGYTVKAGRCLVSSAERDGMDVVCVVLNCPDMYERSAVLLDNCFNGYKLLKLDTNKVFMFDKVLCKLRNSSNVVVKSNKKIEYAIKPLSADAENAVAQLEIYCENSLIFSEKLYSI